MIAMDRTTSSCYLLIITLGVVSSSDDSRYATKERRCEHLVLVDQNYIYIHHARYVKYRYWDHRDIWSLKDFAECSDINYKLKSCKFLFRVKSVNFRGAYQLCLKPYIFHSRSRGCPNHSKLIVSYADETHEAKCSDDTRSRRCAPPEEDLNLTYESDDLCSSFIKYSGILEIDKQRVPGMVNLISSRPCHESYHKYSWTNKGIVSNYNEDMSEKQYVCEAHIGVPISIRVDDICFEFHRFDAYPGGASLVIDVQFKQLTFNYTNKPRSRVCVEEVENPNFISFKVVPGTDPVKSLHHKFHVKFTAREMFYWERDDYDSDEKDDSWRKGLLILLVIPVLCCTCCYLRTRRRASSIPNPRRDAAESHPTDASRYQTRRPSQQRQTGAGNSSVQEPSVPASSLIPMEPLTSSQTDSADPPPYETTCLTDPNVAPPAYDMLFPNETA